MKKTDKGEYGYRNYNKIRQAVLISAFIIAILAQLIARHFTDNVAAKNILTVMAILTVLPMANIASPFIASLRYSTASRTWHDKIRQFEKNLIILYDLIITSKEQIIPSDAAVVHSSGVFIYCPDKKADTQKAQRFIESVLAEEHVHMTVMIYKDDSKFMKKMTGLSARPDTKDERLSLVVSCLKSISM